MQEQASDRRYNVKSETGQRTESADENPLFTRRKVLGIGAAFVSSAFLAGYGRASDASDLSDRYGTLPNYAVPGTVERIVMPDTMHVRNSEGQATIKVADGSRFYRSRQGTVSGISDFFVGDDIAAEGAWERDVFVATLLMQLLRLVEGPVVGRSGNKLQTVNDIVRLDPDTTTENFSDYVGKPLGEITVGDYVYGQAWRDPSTGELVALRISVKKV